MKFESAIKTCFRKYITFSGRASRSEYWWFFAFTIVASYAAIAVDIQLLDLYVLGTPMKWASLAGLITLATLLPILGAGYRRVQDTGLPGWPYIALTMCQYLELFVQSRPTLILSMTAMIIQIILCIRPSTPGPNTYGPNPNEVPT